jgi:hypothetical protein
MNSIDLEIEQILEFLNIPTETQRETESILPVLPKVVFPNISYNPTSLETIPEEEPSNESITYGFNGVDYEQDNPGKIRISKRKPKKYVTPKMKDEAYYIRRARNAEAARKSRAKVKAQREADQRLIELYQAEKEILLAENAELLAEKTRLLAESAELSILIAYQEASQILEFNTLSKV